ncbi:MAG: hypothetical protein ACOH12_04015 [Parvibaculaceae bacterium]
MAFVKFGNRKFKVPGSPHVRMLLGSLLVGGGVLGFLPILGFWMIPLGLGVLSVDSPGLRRGRRRMEVWWGRRKMPKNKPAR